jgi:hypothetical protein
LLNVGRDDPDISKFGSRFRQRQNPRAIPSSFEIRMRIARKSFP